MFITADQIAALDRQERSRRALIANAVAYEDRRRADEARIRRAIADHIAEAARRNVVITAGFARQPLAITL